MIAVIACVHGDERFSLEVIKRLKRVIKNRENIKFLIGNPRAVEENERFIDTDLNRSFPGIECSDSYEERRACELMKELEDCDYVIDLHSSTSKTPPIAIITRNEEGVVNFAKSTGVKRVCLMTPELAHGRSLISNVDCGVSLEMSKNNASLVQKGVSFVHNVLNSESFKGQELFKITGFERDLSLELDDFRKFNDYYPIMVDEEAYEGVKCLKGRKVNKL